jgi:dolichol-phosphate mannosyltransferase
LPGLSRGRIFAVLDRATTDNTGRCSTRLPPTSPGWSWAPENRCVVDAHIRGYREALAFGSD